jgi:hypothetical protein
VTCTCHDDALPLTFENMLSDPLVHMVMASDGVSMDELIAVLEIARTSVVAREMDMMQQIIAASALARGQTGGPRPVPYR